MKIGLYDVDFNGKFPNIPIMKISAYHKSKGDEVEFINHFNSYDIVYVSKVFGSEYSQMDDTTINAKKIIYGGTGFAIDVVDGKEVYYKSKDKELPYEIEHIYPDYDLYGDLTKNKAYGFLTRGCCNNCGFCIVCEKEGKHSRKVADLSEWWRGQKEIVLLDPNILACKDKIQLLNQILKSNAKVDFTQGLDARFINPEICELLKQMKVKMYHFAFDFMRNEKRIMKGLETFVKCMNYDDKKSANCYVYVLTNYNTTFEEDYRRVKLIQSIGLSPDIRIYRKNTAPQITRDLQRWCNNRIIYRSQPDFMKYIPRADGKTIKEIYFSNHDLKEWRD